MKNNIVKTICFKCILGALILFFSFILIESILWLGEFSIRTFSSKSANQSVINLYVLGGSTSYGEPYDKKISYAKIVSYILNGKINNRKINIINFSNRGQRLEANYWKLYKNFYFHPPNAGILLIYSGINDYLEFPIKKSNVFIELLNKSILISKIEYILINKFNFTSSTRRYILNYTKIINLAKKNNVKVIASTLVSNWSEYPYVGQRIEDECRNIDKIREGLKYEKDKNYTEAIKSFKDAVNIIPPWFKPALFTHIAKNYYACCAYENALLYFRKRCSGIRPSIEHNELIKKIAIDNEIDFVDPVPLFSDYAEDKIVGYNLFMDAHHPNLEGYIIIAELFAKKIAKIYNIHNLKQNIKVIDIENYFNFNADDYFDVYNSRAIWLAGESTQALHPEELLKKGDEYIIIAKYLKPDAIDLILTETIYALLRGQTELSLKLLKKGDFLNSNFYMLRDAIWWVDEDLREKSAKEILNAIGRGKNFESN